MKFVVPLKVKDNSDFLVSSSFTHINSFPVWQSSLYFYQGDLVFHNSRLYRAIEDNLNKQPDLYVEDFWRDYGAWTNSTADLYDSAKTYAKDDICYHESGYKKYIYKSITDLNTANIPSATVGVHWSILGSVNLYRCLDDKTNNKTSALDGFSIRVKTLRSDSLYLIGLRASNVIIDKYVNSALNSTEDSGELIYKDSASWSEYFFNEFNYKDSLYSPIPLGLNNELNITINHPNNIARLGRLVVGRSFYIGKVVWGAEVGILDFSRIARDEIFGDVELMQGNFAKRADIEVKVATPRADKVKQFLTANRGKEILLDAGEFDSLKIYGFIRDFGVVLENPKTTTLNIKFEGLI